MGEFKPLLTLNGFTMIRLAVQSALDGGVSHISVVTGRESERVRDALRGVADIPGPCQGPGECPRVEFVHNPDFATTDMLHSLKLGLRVLPKDCDAVYLLPADIAAVGPRTFGLLCARALSDRTPVLQPCFRGVRGHPLLIKRVCFEAILGFERDGGLREALKPFEETCVEVTDEGITLDADDSAGFEVLTNYVRGTKGLARVVIDGFLDEASTPWHIRRHGEAVAELAARMSKRLNILGQCLDSELSRSAAALHDMNRLDEHHSRVAAERLRAQGYEAVARVVGAHDDARGLEAGVFSEALMVFVADKLVKETKIVTLEERYAPALARFSEATPVGQRIRRDKAMCREAVACYEELTGDRIYPDA
jgi:CTP:molybdopterin cytidylyltransferase MocA